MRRIGPLIALAMTLVGWTIIVGTTYYYFPQTMNATSPINLAFALITVGLILPSVTRMWRASGENWSDDMEIDRVAERRERRRELISRERGMDTEEERRIERKEESQMSLNREVVGDFKDLFINELDENTEGVDISVKVVEKGAYRQFSMADHSQRSVAEFFVADETGSVILALLDSQTDFPGSLVGCRLDLHEAFVFPFKGLIRLLVAPYGRITAQPDASSFALNTINRISRGAEKETLTSATDRELRAWYRQALAKGHLLNKNRI